MSQHMVREFEDLQPHTSWPLSSLYHEESKLGEYRAALFQECIAEYNASLLADKRPPIVQTDYPSRPLVDLPRRRWRPWARSLTSVLRSRRTRRGQFADEPMRLRDLGGLLETACGVTGEVSHPECSEVRQKLRTWPSAGALYPVELYVAAMRVRGLAQSLYQYNAEAHRLARIGECPAQDDMERMIYADGLWGNASVALILTGVLARTQIKYGERGYRFVLIDAGHMAQNLLLAAEDLGLAAVPLGGFDDDELCRCLGLDVREEPPLYVLLLGRRQGRGRHG